MRHRLSGRQLSRNSSHRHAMLKNMATSLLRHETIRTTVQKAKELRRVVEPLITLAKDDTLAHRRLAFARLRDTAIVEKLFDDLGPRFKTRPGGYTRILRMMQRPGDNADMALMQLVELSVPVDAAAQPADEGKVKDKKAKRAKPEAAQEAPAPAKRGKEKKAAEKALKAEKATEKAAKKKAADKGEGQAEKSAAKKKSGKKAAKKSRS